MDPTIVIGLEVHVQLTTESKMFSWSGTDFGLPPNTQTDPVSLGLPGTLPTMNRKAFELALRTAVALHAEIAPFTKWDRKNYYYPDLPKNYQISQYDQPLCSEGWLEVPLTDDPAGPGKRIRILRAHLEEDAGKLLHEAPGGLPIDHSIVDLNRAGTPLLEIVTYPDFSTAGECVAFAQCLRDLCRTLGVTEGIMQKGHMRFEPNINVVIQRGGQTYKTPIVEIKNLNSFKAVQGAVEYEYQRQIDEWLETGKVMAPGAKSTRGWDDASGTTFLQREKEDAHDYRYFPDPDLVPVVVDEAWLARVQASLPELPRAKRQRYTQTLGLSPRDADIILGEPRTAAFFDEIVAIGTDPKRAAALLLNNLAKLANAQNRSAADLGLRPVQVKETIDLLATGQVGSGSTDRLLQACAAEPSAAAPDLARKHGLIQVSDSGAIETLVDQVLSDPRNSKAVNDIKGGKAAAIGALVGQVMKLSKGQANAQVVRQMLADKLK